MMATPINLGAPFRWLALGFGDFKARPWYGLFYGSCFVLMATILTWILQRHPAYTLSLISGFLIVGPLLCLGIYQVSRAREKGQTIDFVQTVFCWTEHLRQLGPLVLLIVILELIWGRASLVTIAIFLDGSLPESSDVFRTLVLSKDLKFLLTFGLVSAAFGIIAFSMLVISVPMLLDQPIDAVTAVLTSIRVVLENPIVMLVWAVFIGALVTAAFLISLPAVPALGLLFIGPVLGHASWHVYRTMICPV